MKIGLYKIGVESLHSTLVNKNEDVNGRFKEIHDLLYVFNTNGFDIHYINRYDLVVEEEPYDIIFVLNGLVESDLKDILKLLKRKTNKLCFILSEITFIPTYEQLMYIDKVYAQVKTGANNPYQIELFDSGIYKLPLIKFNPLESHTNPLNNFIFGGGERKRMDDILEYVYRPGVTIYGKMPTLGIMNRIPLDEYREELNKHKYSIVLIDDICNKLGFITWRYYENIASDVITFLDNKCDKNEMLLPKNHFLRVSNYLEMVEKMNAINENADLYDNLIEYQRSKITENDINGKNIINKLLS